MKRAEESSALIGERTSSTPLNFALGTAQRRPNCRARIGGARVDEDADILGLAAANAAAAVSGTFVVKDSPTQTAMADRAGARSQVTQLVFAGSCCWCCWL